MTCVIYAPCVFFVEFAFCTRRVAHNLYVGVIMAYDDVEVIFMAATKSNVNVKIDSTVKESATALLDRMGIDQTTAIDMFYRQIIAERRLPFQPVVALTLEEQLTSAIAKKNIPRVKLEADENGYAIVNKNKHPEIYNWVVNG